MAPVVEHHHRNTTKVTHKSFKSRYASKSHLRDLSKGKVENERGKRNTRPLHQQVMSKIERRHQARQKQQQKHKAHVKALSVFSGQNGAPRIVAVVPLTSDANPKTVIENLNKSLDIEAETPVDGSHTVRVERFKQSIQYVPVRKDLIASLDACRIADFVIFVLSAEEEVDEYGETILKAIESQGVSSNIITLVRGLENVDPPKKRPQILASLRSFITHFYPNQEKVHSVDARQECANVMRSLCTRSILGIRWREDRSWMLVDEVEWVTPESEKGPTILTGIVRGKGLKANRLLSVCDWGDFQIEKIEAAPLPSTKRRKMDSVGTDENVFPQILEEPDAGQDDIDIMAPEDVIMNDENDTTTSEAPIERRGVLLDGHHYFEDDESHLPDAPKRLPKGTSSYQAAWYLGDMSDSGSDWEDEVDAADDVSMRGAPLPQDGVEGLEQISAGEPTEAMPSEYAQSEMFLDPSPAEEEAAIQEYRKSKRTEAEEDKEFPDEIELHPNVLARERLSKYRGLKSLRTSTWETTEDKPYEPEEWSRLLQVPDYKGARSSVMREALVGGVQPGTRVRVFLRDVPQSLRKTSANTLTAFSLLRHEHKYTSMNFSINLDSEHPESLKSKEELIIQYGPRRLTINPVFSAAGNTPNNVHKFNRFLHPGQNAMATVMAPMIWGSVPTLFFQRNTSDHSLKLIATGTSQPPSSTRVIAKRIILTGHPYAINRRLVTVRYMFFNVEDVAYFKSLPLFTKRGKSGFIKESLGTHGYFKATFDGGTINPQDSIGVSLYKRIWPRKAKMLSEQDIKALGIKESPQADHGGMNIDL